MKLKSKYVENIFVAMILSISAVLELHSFHMKIV